MDLHRRLARLFALPCAICATTRGAPLVCRACSRDFLAAETPRCTQCALALPRPAAACGRCQGSPPHFDATVVLGDYRPPLAGVVVALKFGHRLELAGTLGALLAERAAPLFDERPRPLLASVPLAFDRLAQRGFNQSFQLARAVAAQLGLTASAELLVRVRETPPQTTLDREARRRNVRGAFVVSAPVRGRHVIVVDDVLTSGSTLDEIARILKAAGAVRVTNLVVARTP